MYVFRPNIVASHFSVGSFSHSPERLRERPNLTKTKLCPSHDGGNPCREGDSCPFAHNLSELRATPMLYRTVLCSWWRKGQCEFGDNCRFAHGEEQLRDATSSSASLSPACMQHTPSPMGANAVNNSVSTSASLCENVHVSASLTSRAEQHPQYPGVLGASLSAASAAAIQNGITVLTSQQAMAIAAAASAAATEACLRIFGEAESRHACECARETMLRDEIDQQFKKGFASSPALMSFFAAANESEEVGSSGDWVAHAVKTSSEGITERPRADSDPGQITENLMAELHKLWVHHEGAASQAAVPLIKSDPYLSASHMTLESYQINND